MLRTLSIVSGELMQARTQFTMEFAGSRVLAGARLSVLSEPYQSNYSGGWEQKEDTGCIASVWLKMWKALAAHETSATSSVCSSPPMSTKATSKIPGDWRQ